MTELSYQLVDIAAVTVPDRRRPPRGIEELAQAIAEAGRLINPITVTEDLVLSAGYRRLLACRALGWEKIPAHVISQADLAASLVEIDENLHRQELTALERAEHHAARKALVLARHPERGHGKAPAKRDKETGRVKGKEPKDANLASFGSDADKKKERTVQRDCQIAESISQDVRDLVRGTPVAQKQAELLKLARLDTEEQKAVAEQLAGGQATNVRQAQNQIKAEKIAAEPPPLPEGPFRVIVVDPPWSYDSRAVDPSHRAANPYPSMTLEEIKALPIAELAHPDCLLWLWTTNAHLFEVPGILEAWGFTHKTILTWAKHHFGTGDWLRGQTEHCVLAIRGKPVVTLTNQTTLLHGELREHSRKPEEFYALVESLCPGSKVELFQRAPRPGWTGHGNEQQRFAESA